MARVGGDECAALLPGVDEKTARESVLRIWKSVADGHESCRTSLGLSLGAATAHDNDQLFPALKQADRHMYQDKLARTGRPPRHLLAPEADPAFIATHD